MSQDESIDHYEGDDQPQLRSNYQAPEQEPVLPDLNSLPQSSLSGAKFGFETPQRTALNDAELADLINKQGDSGQSAGELIDRLQTELSKRQSEVKEYQQWRERIADLNTEQAKEAVRQADDSFGSLTGSIPIPNRTVFEEELQGLAASIVEQSPPAAIDESEQVVEPDQSVEPAAEQAEAPAVGHELGSEPAAYKSGFTDFDAILKGENQKQEAPISAESLSTAAEVSGAELVNSVDVSTTADSTVLTDEPSEGQLLDEAVDIAEFASAKTSEMSQVSESEMGYSLSNNIYLPFVERIGQEASPLIQRKNKSLKQFWLWFAPNASLTTLILGSILISTGLSLRQSLVSVLLGLTFSTLTVSIPALAAKWSGHSTVITSRATFGHFGNILPAIVSYISRVGFLFLFVWLMVQAMTPLLNNFVEIDPTLQPLVIAGLVGVFTAVFALIGFRLISLLNTVITLVGLVGVTGFILLTIDKVDLPAAMAIPDTNWWMVVGGASTVLAFVGMAWSQSGGDLSRYQKPSTSGAAGMTFTSIGMALPALILLVWGSLLAASDPVFAQNLLDNPFSALLASVPTWFQWPVLISSILSLLAAAVLVSYSAGFSLQAVSSPIKRWMGSLLAVVAIVVAFWATGYNQIEIGPIIIPIMITVAVPSAAWAGIFCGEMLLRTRRFDSLSLQYRNSNYPNIRVVPFIGFVAISIIGYGLIWFPEVEFLSWQGYGFRYGLAQLVPDFALAQPGVFVVIVLGLVFSLLTAQKAVRQQEERLYIKKSKLKLSEIVVRVDN